MDNFFDNKLHLCPPIYGRTIYVHEINDLRDIAGLLSNDNQVIGLELKVQEEMS